MTQKTIYVCDNCQKEIGPKKHISLAIATHHGASGVALPPGKNQGWVVKSLPKNFVHFCTARCISQWFGGLLIAAKRS